MEKNRKKVKKLAVLVEQDKFEWKRYLLGRKWRGISILCTPQYDKEMNLTGYSLWVDNNYEITKDFEKDETLLDGQEFRICSVCGGYMDEGYMVEGGNFYACSDKCLEKGCSEEEISRLRENEELFWTEWY